MRVLSLPIDDNLLEVHINLWTSKELVLWNGVQVSKKFHFLGTQHVFTVTNENGYGTDTFRVITSYHWMGYVYDVFRNDKCLLASGKTKLNHQKRGQMPAEQGLDLTKHPRRQARQQTQEVEPAPIWREEDLIL